MKILLLINFFLTFLLCSAQQKKGVDVKVQHIPLPEKLLVTIHSDSLKLDSCQLRMINKKGIAVKTVNFFSSGKTIEASVFIEDLVYGKYILLIIQRKNVLFKEEFNKDQLFINTSPGDYPNTPNKK